MTDNDSKKSLSLKDRNVNTKSLKNNPSSKNVTIQVKRKKIINANTGSEKNKGGGVRSGKSYCACAFGKQMLFVPKREEQATRKDGP